MRKTRTKLQPEYELKHRITGAAIMIALAVVVIPLFLKEPAIEASVDRAGEPEVVQEKAFKSKIEPLNLNTVHIKKKEDEPGDDLKPALLNADEVVAHDPEKDSKAKQEKSEKETPSEEEAQPEEQIVMTEQPEKAEPEEPAEQTTEQQSSQSDAQPSVPKESESGWAVRVGTFAKKENVDSISNLLNKSGFNARHTQVETTLGQATRVWLGPYGDKDTADKVSLRLKTLTGEKGYVTKHAS